jgi:outer membrane protein assembly factor BamB
MDGSCIIEDVLVGSMPEHVHAVDLSRREPLWTKPWLVTQPPATDGSAAVFADQAVWCVELRNGKVRWEHTEEKLGKGAMHMGCIWGGMYVVRVGRPRRLTAFDLQSGTTVWRADAGGFFWFQPYGDHAYCFDLDGEYVVLTLEKGEEVFRKPIGKTVPEAIRTPKKGLMVGTSGAEPESWRDVRVAVSETHVFLQNASGQIVVLGRETGEVEQVVEIDGMPMGRTEPIIYRNHLLLADFNARVYCFEGASGASGLE